MLQRVKAETQTSPTASASPVAVGEESVEVSASSTTTDGANTTTVLKQYIQKRTLYGRFKKAKDTANYSATAMSEIFGRKPAAASSSPWGSTPAITNGSANVKSETKVKAEPSASGSVAPANDMQSTSKLSIRDYFAAKLAAAGKLGGMSAAQFAGREEVTAKREARDDEDDHRHGGIGLSHASHVPAAAAAVAAAAVTGDGFTEDQQESYFNRMMASAIGGKGVQTGRSAKVGLGFGGAGYGGNNPGAGMAGFKQPSALLNARKAVKIDLDAPVSVSVSPEVAAAAIDAAVAAADREADSHVADSPIGAYDEETAEAAAGTDADDSDSDEDAAAKAKKAKKAEKKRRKAAEAAAKAEAEAKAAKAAAGSDSDDEKAAKKAKKKAKKEAAAAAEAAEAAAAAAAAEAQAEADRKAAKKAKKADKKRRREDSDDDSAAKAEPEPVQEKKKKKKSKE